MRLEKVAQEFGDNVEIEWKAFLLRPQPEERPMDKFTRYTESWKRCAEAEPEATFNTWSGEHEPPSFSLPPAMAGKAAQTFGEEAYNRFHWRMLESYFTENRTISDIEVILDVANQCDIDVEEFRQIMGDKAQDFATEVIADHNAAVEAGITGVPAVVVNHEFPFTGAQDTEFYRRIVENAIKLATAESE